MVMVVSYHNLFAMKAVSMFFHVPLLLSRTSGSKLAQPYKFVSNILVEVIQNILVWSTEKLYQRF